MSRFLAAINDQRAALACAATVAVILIAIAHAPAGPVIAGCLLSFGYLLGRSWTKASSRRTGQLNG